MEVAQHPGLRRVDRRLQRFAPQRNESGARVVSVIVAADARQVPVEQQLGLDQERVHVVGRDVIVDAAARPAAPQAVPAMQCRQRVDRDLIAVLDRRRRIEAGDDAIVAEVLHACSRP